MNEDDINPEELHCEKCNNVIEVEQDVVKVTCSICCATIGIKRRNINEKEKK